MKNFFVWVQYPVLRSDIFLHLFGGDDGCSSNAILLIYTDAHCSYGSHFLSHLSTVTLFLDKFLRFYGFVTQVAPPPPTSLKLNNLYKILS